MKNKIEKVRIAGTKVSALTIKIFCKHILYRSKEKKTTLVAAAAAHLIVEANLNTKLQSFLNEIFAVTSDGMPLVWITKYFYRKKNVERLYGPDLTYVLCLLAAKKNLKVGFLGGRSGQNAILKRKLLSKIPDLKITMGIDTPNRDTSVLDSENIHREISKSKPDILFIGLGCPNQELWMMRNKHHLSGMVVIGVGAAFDFIAGFQRQAPMSFRKNGLEWLFRFFQEPKRLWKRYTLYNVFFIYLTVINIVRRNSTQKIQMKELV